MKVGTDGVLLGSWVTIKNARTILDIGTGTGLLSLMLAQKSSVQIDAIEIDAEACLDAQFNFAQSPWNERLQLLEIDFLDFSKLATKQYDLIVSNPPFFKNALHSSTKKKTLARHSNCLPHEKLVAEVAKLLTDDGRFYVILPSDIVKEFIILSRLQGLHPQQIVQVFSKTTDTKSVRTMLCFSKIDCKATETCFTIYDQSSEYTIEYKTLTKDFYLAF